MAKTQVYYRVSNSPNSWFSPEGWSQYSKRSGMATLGEITRDEVYGPAQAQEHVNEIRHHLYNGKLIYRYTPFTIEKITTTTEETLADMTAVIDVVGAYFKAYRHNFDGNPVAYVNGITMSNWEREELLRRLNEKYSIKK